jgi:hypothetical protein
MRQIRGWLRTFGIAIALGLPLVTIVGAAAPTTAGHVGLSASASSVPMGKSITLTDFSSPAATMPPERFLALSNPCSSSDIPVYTSAGTNCVTDTVVENATPGSLDVACPYLGTWNSTTWTWDCNPAPSGSTPVYSKQYLQCLDTGLGFLGLCDPSGFATQTISGFLPGVSILQKVVAVAQIVRNGLSASADTFCAAYTIAEPTAGTSLAQWLMDEACTLLA